MPKAAQHDAGARAPKAAVKMDGKAAARIQAAEAKAHGGRVAAGGFAARAQAAAARNKAAEKK
ncbi:hypothetical protein V8C86DRAFT_3116083 [Haematococcus lacustris]